MVYLILFILSSIVYYLQTINFPLPEMINNYFNDTVSLVLLLKICQMVLKLFKGSDFQLVWAHIIFIWLYFSFLFEGILPLVNERYTADFFDVLAYLLGVLIYLIIERYDLQKMYKM